MPKTVDCPIKGFSGSVVFHDPLTWDVLTNFEDARIKANRMIESGNAIAMYSAFLPGLMPCVAEWKLDSGKHYTAEDFPTKPLRPSILMLDWMVDQISIIIKSEDTDPNE